MWIETTNTDSDGNPVTRSLRHPEVTDGERVEFSERSGKAQVTNDVGEQMINHYGSVESVDGDGASTDSNGSAGSATLLESDDDADPTRYD